jgi:hypothetical protein
MGEGARQKILHFFAPRRHPIKGATANAQVHSIADRVVLIAVLPWRSELFRDNN